MTVTDDHEDEENSPWENKNPWTWHVGGQEHGSTPNPHGSSDLLETRANRLPWQRVSTPNRYLSYLLCFVRGWQVVWVFLTIRNPFRCLVSFWVPLKAIQ